MTYAEFKRHLGKAGISIGEFASLLGVRPSSISNYSKKDFVPLPYALSAVLLGDAADRSIDPIAVLARYGVHGSFAKVRRLDEYRSVKASRQS